jgi:hypothetical protein
MRIVCVIGASDQRAGFDVGETHFHAGAAVLVELGRRNVANDRQMFG